MYLFAKNVGPLVESHRKHRTSVFAEQIIQGLLSKLICFPGAVCVCAEKGFPVTLTYLIHQLTVLNT